MAASLAILDLWEDLSGAEHSPCLTDPPVPDLGGEISLGEVERL